MNEHHSPWRPSPLELAAALITLAVVSSFCVYNVYLSDLARIHELQGLDGGFTSARSSLSVFNIPELGIRLSVPGDLSELIYTMTNERVARVSSTALIALNQRDYCNPASGGLGAFSVIPFSSLPSLDDPNAPWWGTRAGLESAMQSHGGFPPQVKKFDDFYLLFTPSQGMCSDSAEGRALEPSRRMELWNSLPSAELIANAEPAHVMPTNADAGQAAAATAGPGLLTYENKEDGYIISYGRDFFVVEGAPLEVGGTLGSLGASVMGNGIGTVFKPPLSAVAGATFASIEIGSNAAAACDKLELRDTITLGGRIFATDTYAAYQVEGGVPSAYVDNLYSIKVGDSCYIINARTNGDSRSLSSFTQTMLSTMRFTLEDAQGFSNPNLNPNMVQ